MFCLNPKTESALEVPKINYAELVTLIKKLTNEFIFLAVVDGCLCTHFLPTKMTNVYRTAVGSLAWISQ